MLQELEGKGKVLDIALLHNTNLRSGSWLAPQRIMRPSIAGAS